jgi:GT2 family glycosyltransferase
MTLPFITVCMPVLNEERFIAPLLGELLAQNYHGDRFEIIVADGGSTDRTREIVSEIARRHPQVILKDNPGRLPSSGRNVGFKTGRGDLFLVIDGHCEIRNPQLLRNVADCFERSGAHCLGRPQPFILPEAPTMQRAIGLARSSWLGHSSKSFIHSNREGFVSPVSVGCAYRREVFEKIGYVDESFDACEDVEFNTRVQKAGFKTFFSPSIAVHYHPRETLRGLWRQLYRYAKGRVRFLRKHAESWSLDTLLPSIWLLGMVTGPLFGLLHQAMLWIYISAVALYLFLVARESIRQGHSGGPLFVLSLAAVFVTIHVCLGLGFLLAAAGGRFAPLRRARHSSVDGSRIQITEEHER